MRLHNVNMLFQCISILMVLLLTSCQISSTAPDCVVYDAIEALNRGDADKFDSLVLINDSNYDEEVSEELSVLEEQIYDEIMDSIGVRVINSKIDGDEAIVTTQINSKSLWSVYDKFSENLFDGKYDYLLSKQENVDQILDMIFLELLQHEISYDSQTYDIKMVKVAGQWKIILDDPLVDVFIGGLSSVYEKIIDNYNYYVQESTWPDKDKNQVFTNYSDLTFINSNLTLRGE